MEPHYIHPSQSRPSERRAPFQKTLLSCSHQAGAAPKLPERRWRLLSFGARLPALRRVLTFSGERVGPSHAGAFLGEVSGESGVVNLLHVLLDFSFGVLQQVRLTLGAENGGNGGATE